MNSKKSLNYFFISMTKLLSRELFSFHEYVGILLFLLQFKNSLSPWWSNRMHGINSIFISLLKLVLCVYGHFWRRTHEVWEKVYSLVLGWNVQYISVKSIWFITSVSFTMSSFCIHDLPMVRMGCWRLPLLCEVHCVLWT